MRWRMSSQVHTATASRVGSGLVISIEAFTSTLFRRGVIPRSLSQVEPNQHAGDGTAVDCHGP